MRTKAAWDASKAKKRETLAELGSRLGEAPFSMMAMASIPEPSALDAAEDAADAAWLAEAEEA